MKRSSTRQRLVSQLSTAANIPTLFHSYKFFPNIFFDYHLKKLLTGYLLAVGSISSIEKYPL